jgi:hypothetical protein
MASFTVKLSRSDWVRYYKKLGAKLAPAAKRGAFRAALRARRHLIIATDDAPPASPRGSRGAVNTGAFKRSWKASREEYGARVYNDRPYAGVVEHGRRRGKFPPIDEIARWAQRKLTVRSASKRSKTGYRRMKESEARGVAFVIARAIARRGLKGRKILTNSQPAIRNFLRAEVHDELEKALAR